MRLRVRDLHVLHSQTIRALNTTLSLSRFRCIRASGSQTFYVQVGRSVRLVRQSETKVIAAITSTPAASMKISATSKPINIGSFDTGTSLSTRHPLIGKFGTTAKL